MQLKSLVLLATLALTSVVWAEDDPYIWLEQVDGEKALDWVRAENASTAERLKNGPLFDELYADARAILNSSSRLPNIYQQEDWLYNYWRDEKNPRGIFRRTSLTGFASDEPEWEIVIDIDALNQTENKQWVFKGMR
ncbi:MAG: S9 family peptidase, partial [Gammaproteobacteria bacterium]|nr:S9 family peptidase [Gammaproteobacteria bacterium]